ncbi:MAG: hypothetical protein A3I05_05255 [Deltaproteobacteria bacterium RIFCSPLOWO2_02_FULL_44_10]|nr:MAG: hypothetical protein A3C46_06010 [Deltaproteobacteria bacterium RIFCSPHIGHO2_02_FULL_44_16]OGQ45999.1 MAG: hypothetical protein A3I05_05255 [Deltaproteobacteria bacterium RIFCSPLOWO2_02_FULL_44_10]
MKQNDDIVEKSLSEAASRYGKNPHMPDFCLRFSLPYIEASFPASEDAARIRPPAAFFQCTTRRML